MFNELDSTSTNSPVYRAGIHVHDVTTLFQREESVCERSQLSPRNRLQRPSFLACRYCFASIVLERYFRTEVSLLYFYACERDGPI